MAVIIRYLVLLLVSTSISANILNDFRKDLTKEIAAAVDPFIETVLNLVDSQCSNLKKIIGVAYEQLQGGKEPDLNHLTLVYIDPQVHLTINISSAAQRILSNSEYKPDQKLYIFLHGFTDDPSKGSFKDISETLIASGNANVLALDASSLIKWLYLRSTSYVHFIGTRLGEVLQSFVLRGVKPEAIHIIGHSLGAHIAGFTGKTFRNLTGFNVGRISGLDPAGPCYGRVTDEQKLSSNDADFVDAIHTDAGVLGMKEPVGHIDFYPNKGQQQPNCLLDSCNHGRAWQYYVESIANSTAFPAVKCESWDQFKRHNCSDEVSYMGFPATPDSSGSFYLQTLGNSPFSLQMNGTFYYDNEALISKIEDGFGRLFG